MTQDFTNRLGLISLVCLVVANMIGAGVYTSSGFALGDLGSKWLVMLAWATAGAIALLGALCYGRLAKWVTASGGEYLFLSRAVHPLAGFMAGWISLTAGFSGAIAYSALTFGSYLPKWTWLETIPSATLPVLLILFFGGIHLLGVHLGTRLQNGLVGIKLIFLLLFTLAGLYVIIQSGPVEEAPTVPVAENITSETTVAAGSVESDALASNNGGWFAFPISAFATSLMWISFSYAGYNAAVYVAGATTGGATVSRSMWLATILVTAIYLTLNAVILFSSPAESLNFQPNVLNVAANSIGGARLESAMAAVILLSLATSVSAMLQVGPHVYAQMARDGLLPKQLAVPEADLPRAATVLQIVLAVALTLFADLQSLLDYLGFLLTLSAAATVSILILPKIRKQLAENNQGTDAIAPILFVAASLLISALSLRYRLTSDPKGLALALLVLPLGLLAYFIFKRTGQFQRI